MTLTDKKTWIFSQCYILTSATYGRKLSHRVIVFSEPLYDFEAIKRNGWYIQGISTHFNIIAITDPEDEDLIRLRLSNPSIALSRLPGRKSYIFEIVSVSQNDDVKPYDLMFENLILEDDLC